jgi:hypothetical protein
VLIKQGETEITGSIDLGNVSSRDTISINGNCTGTADVTITVATTPPTPTRYTNQNINDHFTVN